MFVPITTILLNRTQLLTQYCVVPLLILEVVTAILSTGMKFQFPEKDGLFPVELQLTIKRAFHFFRQVIESIL